ncbi:SOS response-associated peptidase [Synechococcus sp. CS-1325]|uniref:SOS response-associated peptidase n=1 Tax=unclassified Synechococcus TaxID=2626047 RepID=UPI000DB50392|nr:MULTISPECIES: SOS response-associated peptidase [unclassified Synechococcus]PZV02116.1 MAG: SOS response-associated peptidase [Cyanobium sp.]MCT0198638.1 SOS response-associated peptidase [Synechococcus sp. CS-1325]MCT0212767.1 SOS response-associated peptidase [Synechococcus sp. CS-1326]MCT0230017.1 SOS response-associated peptidase [Synechococcus sp. CS-1324]MCT0232599.1 SOS response-associated peptidase [Synechococcus sp. CS-1327]
MCGRYSLSTELDRLLPRLRGSLPGELAAHYAPVAQVSPGQPVLALRQEHGVIGSALLLWGLLPEWARDPLAAARPINARRETVAEKATFKGAWRHRRCLLPADGFYEWTSPRGRLGRQPWLIQRRDRQLFWLAGLWDRWIGPDGSEVESCCVLTTAPNTLVAPIHNRMPVILPDGLEEAWLAQTDGAGLRALEPLMVGWDPREWEALPRGLAPPRQRDLFD